MSRTGVGRYDTIRFVVLARVGMVWIVATVRDGATGFVAVDWHEQSRLVMMDREVAIGVGQSQRLGTA